MLSHFCQFFCVLAEFSSNSTKPQKTRKLGFGSCAAFVILAKAARNPYVVKWRVVGVEDTRKARAMRCCVIMLAFPAVGVNKHGRTSLQGPVRAVQEEQEAPQGGAPEEKQLQSVCWWHQPQRPGTAPLPIENLRGLNMKATHFLESQAAPVQACHPASHVSPELSTAGNQLPGTRRATCVAGDMPASSTQPLHILPLTKVVSI